MKRELEINEVANYLINEAGKYDLIGINNVFCDWHRYYDCYVTTERVKFTAKDFPVPVIVVAQAIVDMPRNYLPFLKIKL